MQVLVVEDEKRLAQAIGQILEDEKYMVDIVYDGEDGYDYAREGIYDVIILDVMLPKMDGFQVARQLRKDKITAPIIMLTAKDDIEDKIQGLDCGADDYMTKPFVAEELLARIRAVTRRKGEVVLDTLKYKDLELNLETGVLTLIQDTADEKLEKGKVKRPQVHLSYKEFEIIKLFMTNPQNTYSKEDIIVKVWGYDSEATGNNVEAYVSFLRKKLAHLGSQVKIEAIRKIGYKIG